MKFSISDILWATTLAAMIVNQWRWQQWQQERQEDFIQVVSTFHICSDKEHAQLGVRVKDIEKEMNPILWIQAHDIIYDHEQRLRKLENIRN